MTKMAAKVYKKMGHIMGVVNDAAAQTGPNSSEEKGASASQVREEVWGLNTLCFHSPQGPSETFRDAPMEAFCHSHCPWPL